MWPVEAAFLTEVGVFDKDQTEVFGLDQIEPLAEPEEDEDDKSAILPHYYLFPGGVWVRHISAHLTSGGGQALQYIARSTRLDGNIKGDPIENLEKAIQWLEWEKQRFISERDGTDVAVGGFGA